MPPYEFLVKASPDLIFMLDREGRFTFVNDKLKHVFDYDADRLIGRPWSTLLDPSLIEPLRHHINERRTGPRATHHMELDYTDARGRLHVIELSARGLYETVDGKRVFTGTYGIIRDVTEPRKRSRVLMQSQEKFYGLFMNSPDAIFISRIEDGELLEGNASFAAMADGLAEGDPGTDMAIWGSPEERRSFVEALQRSPVRLQRVLERHVADERRFFEITARQLELDGHECLMASVKDLTAHKQAEQDRLSLEMQLHQASRMEAIGELAGGIAHDFNNILASIIGYSELALGGLSRDTESAEQSLEQVIAAGERARDLVSQMLAFTRAHRGPAELVRIDEKIEEVSRMLRAAIPKSIDITTEFEERLPPVHIDPVQLQQVVINLMIHARDAVQGRGRILVTAGRSTRRGSCTSCGGEYDGEHVVLSVADTGHGIAESMLPRIFEMFVSTPEIGRGAGIGLWLIHAIVHHCEGHVSVVSGPEGTRFDVLLPVPMAPREAPYHAEHSAALAPPDCSGPVLVIDDEVSLARFMGEVLGNAGYEVRIFNDAAAAREHIRASAEEIALILTDHAMPQVSGFEIAQTARQQAPWLPVVLLSSHKDDLARDPLELGLASVLDKPFRVESLLATVREHVRCGEIRSGSG